MSELDLQRLWQEQPLEAPPLEPDRASSAPQLDFAAPTAAFGAARPQVKVWRVVAGAVALAALVAVLLGISVRPPPPRPQPAPKTDDLMAECHVTAGPSLPSPDWEAALKACDRVLKLEPGREQAAIERAHLTVLRACEANFKQARALTSERREEEALVAYERLTPACEAYFFQAQEPARAVAQEVGRRAGRECRKLAGAKQWNEALPRCELAAQVSCQLIDPTELPGRLELAALLEARSQLQPDAPPWRCERIEVLYRPPPPPDPAVLARAELAQRPVAEFGRALVLYFNGDFHSATVPMEKVLENPAQAQHHEAARALLFDLRQVINVYERGTREVTEGRFEKGAELFRQALAIDEKLILGADAVSLSQQERREALKSRSSYLRKAIVESASTQAYERGKAFADQKDFLQACRSWKLGLSFSRTSIDLLKAATNVCTPRAGDAFARAQTCAQLAAVLDFAVDGDGFAEQVIAEGEARGCPPP